MIIDFVGESYTQPSLPFDAQRSINLYPVSDPRGKQPSAMFGTPGCLLLSTVGLGPHRGAFTSSSGRVFTVSGSKLFEVLSDGTSVDRGSLLGSSGNVTMAENGIQLAVCDGERLYIFTFSTNVFLLLTGKPYASALTVTGIGGYFVVNEINSGRFFSSNLFDGTTWQALFFATAESSADVLLRVQNVAGQLWLFGDKTTEIWQLNGSVFFPFSLVGNSEMSVGIVGSFAVAEIDNSAIWVGKNKDGFGIVYRADGFSPIAISNDTVEFRLQSAPNPDTFKCFSYQEQGHNFLVITGGGLNTAMVYDATTRSFHERCYLNDFGEYELPLAADCIFAFNRHLTFDRRNANVYYQGLNYLSDNGDEIARERTMTHIAEENQRITFKSLVLDLETGVGNNVDIDPQVTLFFSDDGARTWSGGRSVSMGRMGEYLKRCIWKRLGQARTRTFRVRITAPVKVVMIGAYLNT
jgi:hypothetical protein